jgi:hypothetical protein
LFERLWGRGMRPDCAQGLPEAEALLALFLTEWNVTLLQRSQACRRVLPPCQRFVPALCSCPRDQTVVGIGQVLWPPSPLGLRARFVQCSGQRLALEVVVRGHLCEGLQGGVDTRGLAGFQHRRFDGAIHPEPTEREARGGTAIHPPPTAPIPGPPPRGATIGDRELPPTPATPAEAPEPGRPPLRGAPGASLRPGALGCQELVRLPQVLPAEGPWVIVQPPHTPLRQGLLLALALRRPSVHEPQLGFGAPLDERPSLVRIAQPLMAAMPTGQAPAEGPSQRPRADLRQRQLGITLPAHRLPGTPQCTELLADACDGVLPLRVGELCDAIITGAYKPHGDCPPDMAAVAFRCQGLAGALPHEAQLLCGHGARHPEDSTLIALARIIEAILLEAERLGQRTEIDQRRPVAMVASQP